MSTEIRHGHVTPRPDGGKAKCFGPGRCEVCIAEQDAVNRAFASVTSSAVGRDNEKVDLGPFDYHAPTAEHVSQITAVRLRCKSLNDLLLTLPPCRERSCAITKLEEVSMWANKGIVFAKDK